MLHGSVEPSTNHYLGNQERSLGIESQKQLQGMAAIQHMA